MTGTETPLNVQRKAQAQAAEAAQEEQRATQQAETPPTAQNAAQTASGELNRQAAEDYPKQTAAGQKITAQGGAENKNQNGETVRVVERLKEIIPEISDMHPVAKTSSDAVISYNGQTMAEKARVFFEKNKRYCHASKLRRRGNKWTLCKR